MKKIAVCIGIIGLVLFLGAAGGSDLGKISCAQSAVRGAVGLACMAIGMTAKEKCR